MSGSAHARVMTGLAPDYVASMGDVTATLKDNLISFLQAGPTQNAFYPTINVFWYS